MCLARPRPDAHIRPAPLAVLTALVLAVAFLAAAPPAAAHPESRAQLELVNARIAADPTNPELYLKRGQIYFRDQHWDEALADYERARELGLDRDLADLVRGELYVASGRPAEAESVLGVLLERRPDSARALYHRALARVALGRDGEAADDYERALDATPGASPDLCLEVVRALVRAGRGGAALRRADEGIRRFGPVSGLAAEAVEIQIRAKRYDDALARLEELSEKPGFRERWLVRRAEVLELAGRPGEALAAYRKARAALAERPPHRRRTQALRELDEKIASALARLANADL